MTPFPLAKSDTNTKILITLFLVTIIGTISVAELNVYDKVGRIKNGVVQRYGPEPPAPPPDAALETLPLEALPSENDVLVSRMNTFSSLLDITHPHLFEMPLIMFVLAHFLMRTRVREWLKLTTYVTAFGGVLLFIATPWLVRYVSVKMGFLLYVGAVAIGATSLIMVVIPIWDMWRPGQKATLPLKSPAKKAGDAIEATTT
ncbi:MAG: hypothetical protein K1Y36_15445 [Blastocatellia bacterium]|nr:hypothetical protein [Blastocatellia bacterium]